MTIVFFIIMLIAITDVIQKHKAVCTKINLVVFPFHSILSAFTSVITPSLQGPSLILCKDITSKCYLKSKSVNLLLKEGTSTYHIKGKPSLEPKELFTINISF